MAGLSSGTPPVRADPARVVELGERYRALRARADAACLRAERRPEDVTIVAVSKFHPVEDVAAAHLAGIRDFGENYAQDLRDKRRALDGGVLHGDGSTPVPADVRWHFVGAVQSNKARYLVPGAALIHALDRESAVEAIAARARSHGIEISALVEVNIGRQASKSGIDPSAVKEWMESVRAISEGIRWMGLMCIPPPTDDPEAVRPHFRTLRALRDRIHPTLPGFDVLSMGMSDDFEVAIEEGATHVRIGTALFGERPTIGR